MPRKWGQIVRNRHWRRHSRPKPFEFRNKQLSIRAPSRHAPRAGKKPRSAGPRSTNRPLISQGNADQRLQFGLRERPEGKARVVVFGEERSLAVGRWQKPTRDRAVEFESLRTERSGVGHPAQAEPDPIQFCQHLYSFLVGIFSAGLNV